MFWGTFVITLHKKRMQRSSKSKKRAMINCRLLDLFFFRDRNCCIIV